MSSGMITGARANPDNLRSRLVARQRMATDMSPGAGLGGLAVTRLSVEPNRACPPTPAIGKEGRRCSANKSIASFALRPPFRADQSLILPDHPAPSKLLTRALATVLRSSRRPPQVHWGKTNSTHLIER